MTALVTGLVLLPGGLLEGALSPFAGRLYDRFGPQPLIAPGMFIVMGSLFWLSAVSERSSVWLVAGIYILFSVGLAALFTPVMTTALGSLPANLYGHGSAIFNTLQQLAGAAGTALMITIYGNVGARAVAGAPLKLQRKPRAQVLRSLRRESLRCARWCSPSLLSGSRSGPQRLLKKNPLTSPKS